MIIRPNFKPAGSRWGTSAYYYDYDAGGGLFKFLLFGDGTMIAPPGGFPTIVPPAPVAWTGDVGEGVARDWVFSQADPARLGGSVWWREDLQSLWNRKLDELVTPPGWMTSMPGENAFCRWRAFPIPTALTKLGKVRINAQKRVRIEIAYLQPPDTARLWWYAENRTYQVWPPYNFAA